MSRAGDEKSYVRAVEAAWSKINGRPVVVSPRDFEAVDAWRRRGIPLSLVLEVLSSDAKRRSRGSSKALTSLSHAVNEAWLAVAAGRSASPSVEVAPSRAEARREWEDALARSPVGTPLRTLLERLLADEARGAAVAALDATLDEELPAAAPVEIRDRAEEETARALAAFRGRMSDEEFQATFARALADRLRAALALPRLALSR